jgi:hypothetical protein
MILKLYYYYPLICWDPATKPHEHPSSATDFRASISSCHSELLFRAAIPGSSCHFKRPNETSGLEQPMRPDGSETDGKFTTERGIHIFICVHVIYLYIYIYFLISFVCLTWFSAAVCCRAEASNRLVRPRLREITSHRHICKLVILRWQALVFKRTNSRVECETTDAPRQKHAPKGPSGSQKRQGTRPATRGPLTDSSQWHQGPHRSTSPNKFCTSGAEVGKKTT